jgi:bacillithiol synthase
VTDVRIITEPLGGSALSQLLQRGEAPAHWLSPAPSSAKQWRERALRRAAEGDWTARWTTLAPALRASGAAAARLARVQREGGVVVTTGQQPGLFGGPIYTWSKAMSAVALADALEAATGVPTAPIFWAATDDADFAEAASTMVARGGGVELLRATLAPPAGTPMSLAPLGDLVEALRRLEDASGSAADPRALRAAQDAYGRPERSTGDAFVQLLRTILEPMGMAVLDASHDAVAAASDATLRTALRDAAEIERALRHRSDEIRAAGQFPQVEEVAGLSLVFIRDGGVKRRLRIGEMAGAVARLTPNVLLRPIVEREILPTVAYVAGPGELAYFAQVGAASEALGLVPALAVPRWSCTLIEPHVAELLHRLDISVADLARPDALEGRLARRAMRPDTAASLTRLRKDIAAVSGELADDSARMGLSRAVQGAAQAMLHRVDRLERRLLAGVKRQEVSLMRDVATLRAALYPGGKRQERALNAIPILARNGLALLDEMRDAARPHAERIVAGEHAGSHSPARP